jgi:hypothetical protein
VILNRKDAVKRWSEIDALRGLMLVLMTLTHLPTRFSDPLGQPFGFVSAAEGFVFLSAFMAGYIFAGRATAFTPCATHFCAVPPGSTVAMSAC